MKGVRVPTPTKGRIVAYYAEQSAGVSDYTPAIIVRVLEGETVNLRLFTDDNATRRVIGVCRFGKHRPGDGWWDWMPHVA